MGTHHTGIPLSLRNIQPPLSPVTKITINKVITDELLDTKTFYVNVTLPNGYIIPGIPISQQQPLSFEKIQYGDYTVTEELSTGYTLTSITPSTFTISASNPQQVVEIVNSKDAVLTSIKYGLLYNWYAATDSRNITSSGWHVLSDADWTNLTTYLGDLLVAGGLLKETGTVYWNSPNTGATNYYLFNGRGNGYRFTSGTFDGQKTLGSFWSSTLFWSEFSYGRYLYYNSSEIERGAYSQYFGFSVRVAKDSTSLANGVSGTYIGNDGKIYRTICINEVEYLADCLVETKYRNGDIIPFAGANGVNFTNAEWAALTTGALCAYDNDWNNV